MRGEIISFDETAGTGLISGEDSVRYPFDRSAFQPATAIHTGQRVDFVVEAGFAQQIMLLTSTAPRIGVASGANEPFGSGDITAFDWQKMLLSFEGRARRSHFWIGWLILLGAGVVAGWIPFLGILISLALIWPNLAITVKRLHDMGHSGWLAAIPWGVSIIGSIIAFSMIGMAAITQSQAMENDDALAIFALIGPAFGLVAIILLACFGFLLWIGLTDSKPGANAYGPNPKGL